MRDINIEELLAREPIELDRRAIGGLIQGRRVLITGAGGSIGSELCRQVAAFNCARLILLDFSETALFDEREMRETYPNLSVKAVLCDVRAAARIKAAFARERPELVLHAAALKHVSMVERHPSEGILTNVLGTWNVAEAARACDAGQMVLISTDKAVDPTNVMGATKRLAEAVIQAQQKHRRRRPLLGRPLWKCSRLVRFGGADLQVADRARRPGHRHAPGHDPVLHDHPGSGAAGAARHRQSPRG